MRLRSRRISKVRKHMVHRAATLVVLTATVFGLALVPVQTPFGRWGPTAASAACVAFTVYEDTGTNGDRWSTCVDDPDLTNNTDGIVLVCNGNPFSLSNWNDCISSVAANFTGNTQVCLWSDTNYTGNALRVTPGSVGWWDMPSWINDGISSIEFSTVDCFAAGNQS